MKFFSILLFTAAFCPLFAQNQPNFWTAAPANDARLDIPQEKRVNEPSVFLAFSLDFQQMNEALREAPHERSVSIKNSPCEVILPRADGEMERFRVVESPIMPAKLAKKYPSIRTFTVQSAERPSVWGKLDIGPAGLHAAIFDIGKTVLIDPVGIGTTDFYQIFDRKTLKNTRPAGTEILSPNSQSMRDEPLPGIATDRGGLLTDPVKLRRFDFALSLTGEYWVLAGGTPATVMAQAVKAVNRFNGIFERDFAMRFDIVDNVDTLFFADAVTDPFPGVNVQQMAAINKDVTDARIGPANYDAGHVFGKFLGGMILGIKGGDACSSNKANAASTDSNPLNDNFIVTVCQEIEHQFAALHTWNNCSAGTVDQYHPNSAFEPGSGSTILSYAGSCDAANNVKVPADDYNHVWSIEQVRNCIRIGFGASCATVEDVANTQPTASIPYANGFYIPKSTPFKLTGVGGDAEDAGLTYNWEQMDLGPQSPLGQPIGTAPLFRSHLPSISPTRFFPALNIIIANQTNKTEVLPTIDRPLNFRFTVRDNHPGGGGQEWAELGFRCDATSGPFRVTNPNVSSVTWKVGEFVKVEWDVAGSNGGLVNCKKVNISLSITGGNAWPILLAAEENNDGTAWIKVPDNITTTARVVIEAVGNVFFDMSNQSFKIEAATVSSFSAAVYPDAANVCLPQSLSVTLKSMGLGGFNGPISLAVTGGVPAGGTAIFVNNIVNVGQDATLNIDLPQGVAEGDYAILVSASAAGLPTIERSVNIHVVSNDFSAVALLAPADGASGQGLLPTFTWNTAVDANNYEWQLSENPSFSVILSQNVGLAAGTTQPTLTLFEGRQYFWRVRPSNECGVGNWVGPFSFATKTQSCQIVESSQAINISGSGTPEIESKIQVNQNAIIGDVNVPKVIGSHEFFTDLTGTLISPSGTQVILWKNKCGNFNGNFKFGFDDQAAPVNFCPPTNDVLNTVDVSNKLDAFNGQNAQGEWKLRVKDKTSGSGGQLTSWKLELCVSTAANPPVLVNNNSITVFPGTNKAISTGELKTEDPNNTPPQLLYTIVKPTSAGDLKLWFGQPLVAGSQFTQADIDAGGLAYFQWGGAVDDHFTFTVIDGEGGYIGTTKYQIFYDVTGANEPQLIDFQLIPNPATDQVTIQADVFSSPTDWQLVAATGQILRSGQFAAGENRPTISLAGLAAGIHFFTLKNGEKTGVKRLVIE